MPIPQGRMEAWGPLSQKHSMQAGSCHPGGPCSQGLSKISKRNLYPHLPPWVVQDWFLPRITLKRWSPKTLLTQKVDWLASWTWFKAFMTILQRLYLGSLLRTSRQPAVVAKKYSYTSNIKMNWIWGVRKVFTARRISTLAAPLSHTNQDPHHAPCRFLNPLPLHSKNSKLSKNSGIAFC